MLCIGCHLSSAGGLLSAVRTAKSIGANTFQFFTRNPRGSRARPADETDIRRASEALTAWSFGPLIAHGAYTMNLCTADSEARQFAAALLRDDLERTAQIPGSFYNFHPGSHVGQGIETGISQISAALNQTVTPDLPVTILLETMSGKGSEIGFRFEHLREIMDRCTYHEKLGVCMDTCHVWDAGYDLIHNPDEVLAEFDRIIGLKCLHALHINSSLNVCGSHKDRHARLGEGTLPFEALVHLISHPALRNLPMILETPNDLSGYAKEITRLREACGI